MAGKRRWPERIKTRPSSNTESVEYIVTWWNSLAAQVTFGFDKSKFGGKHLHGFETMYSDTQTVYCTRWGATTQEDYSGDERYIQTAGKSLFFSPNQNQAILIGGLDLGTYLMVCKATSVWTVKPHFIRLTSQFCCRRPEQPRWNVCNRQNKHERKNDDGDSQWKMTISSFYDLVTFLSAPYAQQLCNTDTHTLTRVASAFTPLNTVCWHS